MTALLDDFAKFVSDVEASSLYAKWKHDNTGEDALWQKLRSAILTGSPLPPLPAMGTRFGMSLVDAAKLYLDSAALAPVPGPTATVGTFEALTAYLDEPVPTDGTIISSAAQVAAAFGNAKPGDVLIIDAGVIIPGEFVGFQRQAGGVKVVFRPGAVFSGGGGDKLPAVWLKGNGGWRVWGGRITNPNGGGILQYATAGPFVWTGFDVADVATTGVSVFQVGGDIVGVTLKGRSGSKTARLDWDPHSEKGTGFHAWNIADVGSSLERVRDSVFACDSDHQAVGSAVEIQQDRCTNVKLFARATNLGAPISTGSYTWFGYAQHQVAGNVAQIWDVGGKGDLDIEGVWADTIMGRMVETDGAGGDLSAVAVKYGRGTATLQAVGKPGAKLTGPPNYAKKNGLVLGDCLPTP